MNVTQAEPAPLGKRKYLGLKVGLGFLAGCLMATVLTLTCSGATNAKPANPLDYISQVGVAIKAFAVDHGGSAPEMANLETFREMVRPYLRESFLFYDPMNFKPLVPNPVLSHVDLSKLPHPESIVLLYDATPNTGRRAIGYADGHVKSVAEAEFRKDLALTPYVAHSLGLYVGKWQTPSGEVTISGQGSATLKTKAGKTLAGKAAIDESDNLSLVFGTNAPAISGKATWLSINELSVKPAGTRSLLLSRIH